MANTLPNIDLPKGVWVNLYTESSTVVGTRIQVENLGATEIRLFTGAAAPSLGTEGYELLRPYQIKANRDGDVGAFAMSPSGDTVVNVKVA